MTRSQEKGENEFTQAAKREAAKTGMPVSEILTRMLAEVIRTKDAAAQKKIVQAQKFLRIRNRRKRRGRR
jgi:hypothetical protein